MTISSNKKVSVIIPNYNYAKYIKKRIMSVVRQTYPIFEIIILDDASTDGSVETIKNIVLDLKLKNPALNIKFVPNQKNSGKTMTQWKKGIELAKGDYIWIAEADDLCSRRFLEEVMKGFNNPGVVLSYTESKIINSKGFLIAPNFRWSRDREKTGHYKKSYIKDGTQEIEEIMAIRCTIPNVSSVVFKNDKKRLLKTIDETTKFTQVGDWYFYVKLLEHGKISYNRKSLNQFRFHKNSKTRQSTNDKNHYTEIVGMHKYFKKNYDLSEDVQLRMRKEQERILKRIYG